MSSRGFDIDMSYTVDQTATDQKTYKRGWVGVKAEKI